MGSKTSYPDQFLAKLKKPECSDPVWSPMTDAEVIQPDTGHRRSPEHRQGIQRTGGERRCVDQGASAAFHQVYVDTGIIVYNQPRPAFYRYLQALVDAGFGKRVMFGSDQMVWPGTINRAVAVIEAAPFLSPAQKRDIFYNNAARFLRLPTGQP